MPVPQFRFRNPSRSYTSSYVFKEYNFFLKPKRTFSNIKIDFAIISLFRTNCIELDETNTGVKFRPFDLSPVLITTSKQARQALCFVN